MSTQTIHGATREIDLHELAMLSGGTDLAIAAAAAWLYGDGLLEVRADRTLQSAGELADDAQPLEREVYATACRMSGTTGVLLRSQLADGAAIEAITSALRDADLLGMSRRVPFGRPRLRATRSGRRLVDDLRTERPELCGHPTSGEAPHAMALFGGGSLWLVEPELASALALPREARRHRNGATDAAWGGWGWHSGGCAGGSCGGGGGCGGGGCGGGG